MTTLPACCCALVLGGCVRLRLGAENSPLDLDRALCTVLLPPSPFRNSYFKYWRYVSSYVSGRGKGCNSPTSLPARHQLHQTALPWPPSLHRHMAPCRSCDTSCCVSNCMCACWDMWVKLAKVLVCPFSSSPSSHTVSGTCSPHAYSNTRAQTR